MCSILNQDAVIIQHFRVCLPKYYARLNGALLEAGFRCRHALVERKWIVVITVNSGPLIMMARTDPVFSL